MKKKSVSKKTGTKKSANNGLLLALGGIAAGTALVLMKGKKNEAVASVVPVVPVNSGTTTIRTSVKSTSVQPVPVTVSSMDNTAKNHVFVNSWPEGESVYGKAENAFFKANSDFIITVNDTRYLGKITGMEAKDNFSTYVQVGSFIDSKFRTYWVNKKAVKFVTDAEKNRLLKGGGGTLLTVGEIQAFRKYFLLK